MELETMKRKIEDLSENHQTEILKILSKNLCKLNENKNGVFVNMSFLPDQIVEEIKKYIDFISEQESSFDTIEYQKEEYKNSFFIEKQDKDNVSVTINQSS
jgi:predicted lipoprotein